MRILSGLLACLVILGLPSRLLAEATAFPSPAEAEVLHIYSSLDTDLAAPLIKAFQAQRPEVSVHYETLLTGELHERIIKESEAGQGTADFVFSSAMDLQVKLANDGYAREVLGHDDWPDWANWRNAAFALTFEPAVFAYHKPSFPDAPPATRADLIAWMAKNPQAARGKVGTYDVHRSGVGYLFLARDQELYPEIWSVIAAMGRAQMQQFPTSGELLERIGDGRLVLGYNLLGSYVADWARRHPQIGLILPQDFTVVVSRVALVPERARARHLGEAFLAFLMSPEGQGLLSRTLRLSAVSLEVAGQSSPAGGMQELAGQRLRPLPVSPGLLAYLDQATRAKILAKWDEALAPQ